MFQSFGFDGRVSVLDGGLAAWTEVGGVLTSETYPSTYGEHDCSSLPVRPAIAGAFVDKHHTLSALGDKDITIVDSLSPESFNGSKRSRYGRRGHITSAVNVPYASIVDSNSGRFYSADTIRSTFEKAGVCIGGETAKVLVY